VNIEISGDPSDVTLGTNQVTFTSDNWSTAQPVSITATDDADTASHSAFTLSHGVLGGGYTGMNVEDVDVQVLDDEASQVVVSTTAVTVNEGGSFTYTISLTDEPSADETVTVDLVFSTGDFTSTETSVTDTSEDDQVYEEPVTATSTMVTVKNVPE